MDILLSITIPTYNRANFLRINLEQLKVELQTIEEGLVEIIVSDNCSEDDTTSVIEELQKQGLKLQYVRNERNMGWGFNFFQCFNLARGRYVHILSDDDLLSEGSMKIIVEELQRKEYGVVCLQAYGYDIDFRKELPPTGGSYEEFADFNSFFYGSMPLMTLLSASIFNKSLIRDVDTTKIDPGNFAHLHLILRAAASAKYNLFVNKYLIASKRNNSSNYNYTKVFVEELWELCEYYKSLGLTTDTIVKTQNKFLKRHYPNDALNLRRKNSDEYKSALLDFKEKFGSYPAFKFFTEPILSWHRTLAIPFGFLVVIIGKLMSHDLRFVLMTLKYKVTKFFN
jgi:abequosyltransferase